MRAVRTTSAERTREWRRRLRDNLFAVRTEISAAVVEMLIAKGLVSPKKENDRKEWVMHWDGLPKIWRAMVKKCDGVTLKRSFPSYNPARASVPIGRDWRNNMTAGGLSFLELPPSLRRCSSVSPVSTLARVPGGGNPIVAGTADAVHGADGALP